MRRFCLCWSRWRHSCRRPPMHVADEVIATTARPTPVSAHAGRIVWSDYDPAQRAYFLAQRVNGVTSRVPVRPRCVPFDVDLGPDVNGETVAAYSRCAREPPPRSPAHRKRDRTDAGLVAGARVRHLQVRFRDRARDPDRDRQLARCVGVPASVWKARVAFARVYERQPGSKGERAYLYARPIAGAARSRRLIAGSRSDLGSAPAAAAALHAARGAGADGAGPLRPAAGVRVGLGAQESDRRRRSTSRRCAASRRRAPADRAGRLRRDPGQPSCCRRSWTRMAMVVWGRALFGDSGRRRHAGTRYRPATLTRRSAEPQPGEALIRTALATAVDAATCPVSGIGAERAGRALHPQSPVRVPPRL